MPEEHKKCAVILEIDPASGETKGFTPECLMFGEAAAVLDYNLVSATYQSLVRRLLGIGLTGYFDDFTGLGLSNQQGGLLRSNLQQRIEFAISSETRRAAASSECDGLLQLAHVLWLGRIIGSRFKEAKTSLGCSSKFLGVHITFSRLQITINLGFDRIDKLFKILRRALESNSLLPEEASSLAGKLSFCTSSAMYGRLGRGFLWSIYRRAESTSSDYSLDGRLSRSLLWWKHLLQSRPQAFNRTIPYYEELAQPTVIYADAAVEDTLIGRGVADINERTLRSFVCSSPGQTNIAFEEAAAILDALSVTPATNTTAILFTDSTPAQGCVVKGYSPHPRLNSLASSIWLVAARKKLRLWLERVPSALNIADGPSRGVRGAELSEYKELRYIRASPEV